MTLREAVEQLQKQGIKIKFYVRKDGGIVVQKIGDVSYSGKAGNKVVREMAGIELSTRRAKQLERINKQRNWSKPKIKVSDKMNTQLKRVQRLWREKGIKGTISKRNLKLMIQERGVEGAKIYLQEMERHAKGLAYNSQIEGLLARLEQDLINIHDSDEQAKLRALIDKIKINKDKLSPQDVNAIYDELYNYETGSLNAGALEDRIDRIIK